MEAHTAEDAFRGVQGQEIIGSSSPVSIRRRIVEVVADLGAGGRPRRRYGSGLLLGSGQVLTAAHVVRGAERVAVRWQDKAERRVDLDSSLIGDPYGRDVALLQVPDAESLPDLPLAVVDQQTSSGNFVERCWSVGYPAYQEVRRENGDVIRDTAQVGGRIPPLSGLVEGLLSLQVTNTPRELREGRGLGDSEWSGMSGAAVFSDASLIGVVTEHAPPRGSSDVMVTPLYRPGEEAKGQTNPAEWWTRLGVADPDGLPRLPPAPSRLEPPYQATMREIRGYATVLVGREGELSQIAAFAAGDNDAFGVGSASAGYLWLVGAPWTGKTSLLAEAVHTLPSNVDVVAYFLIGRESSASREQFIAAVIPQLAYLLGDSAVTTGLDEFRDLWARAVTHAEDRGRHLLLVVDGLDEDSRLGGRSVAAVLPTPALDARARVLVSSRTDMSLPNDLALDHPLQSAPRIPLSATPATERLRRLAEQEIEALLPRDLVESTEARLTLEVLGLLTAAAGPLTVDDLAVLTGSKARSIRLFVTERAARSLQPVGPEGERGYQFAHQTLLDYCREHPDVGGDPEYVQRLYDWVDDWRAKGWEVADARTGRPLPRFLIDYLPTLLERTGRTKQLHDLLAERLDTGERRLNVWYATKRSAGLLQGYMADVERAWRLAIADGEIALQTRYALYFTSLNDTNVRLPARLLELCLQEGVLTWQEALDSARLHQDPVKRVRNVSHLARKLSPGDRDRVVEAEFEVAARLDEEQRASAFLALVPALPDRLMSDVVETTSAMRYDRGRHYGDQYAAEIIVGLAARLSETDLEIALQIARSIRDPVLKVMSLGALASSGNVQDEPLLAQIRRVVGRMPPTAAKVIGLCEVARLLDGDPKRQEKVVDQALAIAGGLSYPGLTPALTALAHLNAPLVSAERVAEMVELAERAYRDESGSDVAYIEALATLGPLLSDEQRASFVGSFVTRRQTASDWLSDGFARDYDSLLTPYLPRDEQTALFAKHIGSLVAIGARASTRGSLGDRWRARAALKALEQMPEDLLDTALEATGRIQADIFKKEIDVDEGRADVLATLVPRLPPERRRSILRRELDHVGAIDDKEAQARALAALAAHSPEDARAGLAEAALENIQASPIYETYFNETYFKVVASVEPHLQPDRAAAVLDQALSDARAHDNRRSRAKALAALIPSLPAAMLSKAREAIETLDDSDYVALAPLVPRLTAAQRSDVIARILEAVRGDVIGELPADFVGVLRPIAPYLDHAQLVTALDLTGDISARHESLCADSLAILAPHLGKKERERALAMANDLADDLSCVRAVATLAQCLDEPQRAPWLREAQENTKRLQPNQVRVRALVALAPLLPKPQATLSEAFSFAMAIEEDDERADALALLLPRLDGTERRAAFDELLRSCLGSRIAGIFSGTIIREALDRAFLLGRVARVAGVLAAMGGDHAVAETAQAVRETAGAWP